MNKFLIVLGLIYIIAACISIIIVFHQVKNETRKSLIFLIIPVFTVFGPMLIPIAAVLDYLRQKEIEKHFLEGRYNLLRISFILSNELSDEEQIKHITENKPIIHDNHKIIIDSYIINPSEKVKIALSFKKL